MKTIRADAHQVLIERLRATRQASSLTQMELAEALGVDQSYVSKYERGERRLDIIEVRAICKALGTGFVEFVTSLEMELTRRNVRE